MRAWSTFFDETRWNQNPETFRRLSRCLISWLRRSAWGIWVGCDLHNEINCTPHDWLSYLFTISNMLCMNILRYNAPHLLIPHRSSPGLPYSTTCTIAFGVAHEKSSMHLTESEPWNTNCISREFRDYFQWFELRFQIKSDWSGRETVDFFLYVRKKDAFSLA